jgi:sarcosine oxidase
MTTFDVIVIGVGAMGSSACFELARRGVRVLGIEQFDIPHALGSSHGQSRMIRSAYYEHPDYVPLLKRAYERWHELEKLSNQKLLHITGGIYIGPPDGEVVSQSLAAAKQHGLRHELLDAGSLAARYPQFRVPESWAALHEPQAGFLLPEAVIAAYATEALKAGATLHGRERVIEWSSNTVVTDRGTYHAEHLIFCGGAWTGKLLHDLNVTLKVTRQSLAWVWPSAPADFALGKLPVWAIDHSPHALFYGFPMMPDVPGVKAALHAAGDPTDPDQVDRTARPADEQLVRSLLRQYLPTADGPLLSMRTCMYTYSPDSHFIIDHHPDHKNVTIAAGFSGHGFKFASVMGEILGDLAMHGSTKLPAQFLNLDRFGK